MRDDIDKSRIDIGAAIARARTLRAKAIRRAAVRAWGTLASLLPWNQRRLIKHLQDCDARAVPPAPSGWRGGIHKLRVVDSADRGTTGLTTQGMFRERRDPARGGE